MSQTPTGKGGGMADTQPKSDAVIAWVTSQEDVDAVLAELTDKTDIPESAVAHGTGDEFAAELDRSDPDSGSATRLGKWLTSLGQDREGLVEMGDAARKGLYVLVINDVDDDATKETVIGILQRHGGQEMTYIGDWQNEEIL